MLSGLWCYTLSFMVICHSFACLCDSFPGKCASFLHMLRVITDLLPEWIKSLSSRWLMKSCKFFYSPIKRNRCFTSHGIKTLVQIFGSKRKKELDHLTNTTHPGAYACVISRCQNRLNFEKYTVILQCFCIEEISLKKITKRKLTKQIQTIHFFRSMRNIIHIVVTVK